MKVVDGGGVWKVGLGIVFDWSVSLVGFLGRRYTQRKGSKKLTSWSTFFFLEGVRLDLELSACPLPRHNVKGLDLGLAILFAC